MQNEDLSGIQSGHQRRFGTEGRVFTAPARVNLIGEHTDYTGGFVLPMAIDFRTVAVISPQPGTKASLYSMQFDESVEVDLSQLAEQPRDHWSAYPLGTAWALQQAGIAVPGFALTLDGNVPLGSGLSSSASVEVATAVALLSLTGEDVPGERIATLCRRAENEFVGAASGIMDQFVIANAVEHRALLLDCRDLTYKLPPLPDGTAVVVVNTMVKHSVASGDYGERSAAVRRGQAALHAANPKIELLRDATLADLEAARDQMDGDAFLRCRHIITENARVTEMEQALAGNDRARIGELLAIAHASMRDDFAASCPEADALVEIAVATPGCIGARITGGGFGGCTVNLVDEDAAEAFSETVRAGYKQRCNIEAQSYICTAVDGAVARLSAKEPA